MRSKASIKSHPLHPILIVFPIAFFIGAFVFDLLSIVFAKAQLSTAGYYLCIAGVAGGLLAAVPGAIDYFNTVPPKSSAKKRATKHAVLNVTNVLIFLVVIFYRRTTGANEWLIVVLELVGVVVMSIAGWLGGTLVYRNQIGVDPRYASAGKWKEIHLDNTDEPLGATDELKLNQMKLIHLKDKRIVLARTENGYVAFDDRCTHRGGSLAGGAMICGTVQCPWHGSQFDVTTGAVKAGPANENIATYLVQEKDGNLFLSTDNIH